MGGQIGEDHPRGIGARHPGSFCVISTGQSWLVLAITDQYWPPQVSIGHGRLVLVITG